MRIEDIKSLSDMNIFMEIEVNTDGLDEADKAMTQMILDNLDAMEEETVDVLLDEVAYNEKPQGATIGAVANRLPQNQATVTLKELADAVVNGQSWKASVLSDKSNASFVSSSLVALDIDNKDSYTTIDEFMALNHKYQPCFIYETFSSTTEHERFRVVYVFDNTITDYSTMVALYNEVIAQYPTVDIDTSVDPGKILFGGRTLRYFNMVINTTPALTVNPIEVQRVSTPATFSKEHTELVEVGDYIDLDIMMNLGEVAYKYADVKEIDINDSYEWINENVKATDALKIVEGARFRCILPNHEDNHPSARIVTVGNEQVYFCSCEANGYRLITLLSKLLDMSEVKVKTLILDALHISYGSEYQKSTERYIADLRRNLPKVIPQDLKDYLNKRKLFQTYKLIIDFADAHIPYNSFANDNRVVFFIGKRVLEKEMKQNYISGNAGQKLTALCELGLLRKLTDSEIKDNVLANADKTRKALQTKLTKNTGTGITDLNRVDFYELMDLSPSVIAKAINNIKAMKDSAVRQRGININRRANTFGADEVLNNINVQSTINTKKQNKKRTKLEEVIHSLLESKGIFNEAELIRAYYETDRKHMTIAKAQQTVLDFIPSFLNEGLLERVRVNANKRTEYDIPGKYKSNSFVYVTK